MHQTVPEPRIAEMRRFNRLYTQTIGVLDEGLLDSPFSLAEARVLYELAHRTRPTATEIARDLRLDAGYLSRILKGFARRGLLCRVADPADRRRSSLALTAAGANAFAPLDEQSRHQIACLLQPLSETDQTILLAAMRRIERLLAGRISDAEIALRLHRPGDMGWVISRHGAIYAAEYGWDARFEAMVATIVARLLDRFDPARERCWIAEQDGEPVGSIALARDSAEVARLRLLLVEPSVRGHGLGGRLIGACLDFARVRGYRRIVLSTFSVLTTARNLYAAAGFRIVGTEAMHCFGHHLVEEHWGLDLG